MFNLIIILLSTLNGEPKDSSNYRIAKYILEHIREMQDFTLSELAEKCYVSNASLSRFCREIGLHDFNALKKQISQFSSLQDDFRRKFLFEEFDDSSLTRSFVLSLSSNLKFFLDTPDFDTVILDTAKEILSYPKVAAFGYMNSENVALTLQYSLQTVGITVFTAIQFIQQQEFIEQADDDTMILIFSESGSYFERAFDERRPFPLEKNPHVCMITSNENAKYPYIARYIVYRSRHDFASHPYPLQVIADLLAVQCSRLMENTQDR